MLSRILKVDFWIRVLYGIQKQGSGNFREYFTESIKKLFYENVQFRKIKWLLDKSKSAICNMHILHLNLLNTVISGHKHMNPVKMCKKQTNKQTVNGVKTSLFKIS